MYSCPRCRTPLVEDHSDRAVFWLCPRCSGCAVTMAVIRRTVVKKVVNELWQSARARGGCSELTCPSCHRRMADVPASEQSASPPLDVCTRCQLVWFDAMEYEALPATDAPAGPDRPASTKARETLATFELQRLKRRQARRDALEGSGPDRWWKVVPGMLGLPVEESTRDARRIPLATWMTGVLMAMVTLVGLYSHPELFEQYSLLPADLWRHGGLTFITAFFLHAGLFHLLGNLYFLLIFGDDVEDFLGRLRWLVLLVSAALAGAVLHVAIDPHPNIPVVGASGGISGLLAFYVCRFPMRRVGMVFGYQWRYGWVSLPAFVIFGFWLFYQVLGGWMQMKGFGRVSFMAHLGGAAVGVAFFMVWRKRR